jgi:hypothetical protein
MNCGPAEPVTPISQELFTPTRRAEPHNYTVLPALSQLGHDSVTEDSVPETEAGTSHATTLGPADGVQSPTPADHPVIMVLLPPFTQFVSIENPPQLTTFLPTRPTNKMVSHTTVSCGHKAEITRS